MSQPPPPPPPPRPGPRSGWWSGLPPIVRGALVLLSIPVLVGLIGLVTGSDDELAVADEPAARQTDEPAQPAEPRPEPPASDASARAACRHWANVARDASAGNLTDAEIRDKIREVHSSARVSETTTIAGDAETILAAITRGDVEGFSNAAEAFTATCRDADAFG